MHAYCLNSWRRAHLLVGRGGQFAFGRMEVAIKKDELLGSSPKNKSTSMITLGEKAMVKDIEWQQMRENRLCRKNWWMVR